MCASLLKYWKLFWPVVAPIVSLPKPNEKHGCQQASAAKDFIGVTAEVRLALGPRHVGVVRWLLRQRPSSAYLRRFPWSPEMVGHSGCCFGFCARGAGFRGDGGGSRQISRQAEDATYRAYRILSHGILVMLVVFFLPGERITWINCLAGFGWRAL
jgi:hypothetical protein